MQLVANAIFLLVLFLLAVYVIRMPLRRTHTFENSVRLWLIHVILVTATPLLLAVVVYRRGLQGYYASYAKQFFFLVSNFGLWAGLLYVIPWLIYYGLFLLPPVAAVVFSLFPMQITKWHDKLIPSDKKSTLISEFRKSISFFKETLRQVVKRAGLYFEPKIYVRPTGKRGCYVFGNNSRNFVVALTSGFLSDVKNGSFSLEELKAIMSHEVGHVINGDLRLASSVKIFSDVRLIRKLVFWLMEALALIFISTGGIILFCARNLAINQRMNLIRDYSGKVLSAVLVFLVFLLICAVLDVLIRTTFKKREFFADAQGIMIFPDEAVYKLALKKFIHLLNPPTLSTHSHRSSFLDVIIRLSRRAVRFVAEFVPTEILEKIESVITKTRMFFSSHPRLDERTEAITNHTYSPTSLSSLRWGSYFMVGLALVIPFVLFSYVTLFLQMPRSWTIFILILAYGLVCLSFIIISNARLRYLADTDLQNLKRTFVFVGFDSKNPGLNRGGRRLLRANALGQLSLMVIPLFLLVLGLIKGIGFVEIFFPVLVVVQFIVIHFLTYFFLGVMYRFKKNDDNKSN